MENEILSAFICRPYWFFSPGRLLAWWPWRCDYVLGSQRRRSTRWKRAGGFA